MRRTDSAAPPTGRRVMVVDDDPIVLETFCRALRLEGFEVVAAADSGAGLQHVLTFAPEAIVLDLVMPLVDGLAFLRRLRALDVRPQARVAIVTGHYFLEDTAADELRELDAELHLKPIWVDDLIDIVTRLLLGETGTGDGR